MHNVDQSAPVALKISTFVQVQILLFFQDKKNPWMYLCRNNKEVREYFSFLSCMRWSPTGYKWDVCRENRCCVGSFNISRPHSLSMLHYLANYCVDLIFTFSPVFLFRLAYSFGLLKAELSKLLMKATGTKIFLQQDPRNSHLDVYPCSIPPLKRLKRWSLKVKNKVVNHQCFCLCLGSENIGIPRDQMH